MQKHMSKKEKEDFNKLYEYVKKIMGYDEKQALSKQMVLRLRGLSTNKYMENKNIPDTARYSYEEILLTFKYCFFDIQRGLANKTFRDERHKFNYILKIVESNLNTVYIRLKEKEKANKQITEETYLHNNETADYVSKSGNASSNFEELW